MKIYQVKLNRFEYECNAAFFEKYFSEKSLADEYSRKLESMQAKIVRIAKHLDEFFSHGQNVNDARFEKRFELCNIISEFAYYDSFVHMKEIDISDTTEVELKELAHE